MDMAETVPATAWRARLELEFERRGTRSVLAKRRHDGPLLVQKSLYPEGEGICHALVVHPPAGIAGGDDLELQTVVSAGAHAVLATPGAGKWYRSAGPGACQRIRFDLAAGALLEWLPQETILFNGAIAEISSSIRLGRGARYLGWDILCFGRTGAGERWMQGHCSLNTRLEVEDMPIFIERADLEGGSGIFNSPAALAGAPVCGTLMAVSPECDASLLAACRELQAANGAGAVTRLPGVLVARYLGASSEAAKNYFIQLRRVLRPAIMGREAGDLRIWST